jgi:hypothetical protein
VLGKGPVTTFRTRCQSADSDLYRQPSAGRRISGARFMGAVRRW